MKEFFRKFGVVLLAVLMLASTTSWIVEKHYCMGYLVDIAWFDDAKDCCRAMVLPGSSMEMPEEIPCCDNEIIVVDGQDQLKLSFNSIDLPDQLLYLQLAFTWDAFFEDYSARNPIPRINPPPNLVKDICLLDQVFLI